MTFLSTENYWTWDRLKVEFFFFQRKRKLVSRRSFHFTLDIRVFLMMHKVFCVINNTSTVRNLRCNTAFSHRHILFLTCFCSKRLPISYPVTRVYRTIPPENIVSGDSQVVLSRFFIYMWWYSESNKITTIVCQWQIWTPLVRYAKEIYLNFYYTSQIYQWPLISM